METDPKIGQHTIELLTKEQVAKRLQLSTRTVYRKWQFGEIPAPVKVGRAIRWRSDVLNEWIQNNCPKSHGVK